MVLGINLAYTIMHPCAQKILGPRCYDTTSHNNTHSTGNLWRFGEIKVPWMRKSKGVSPSPEEAVLPQGTLQAHLEIRWVVTTGLLSY